MVPKQTSMNFASSYIYANSTIGKKIDIFLKTSDTINVSDPSFSDIMYDLKRRRLGGDILSIIQNPYVQLRVGTPLDKAYKVLCMRGDGPTIIIVDVSDILTNEKGAYGCKNIDVLASYLVSAGVMLKYFNSPMQLTNHPALTRFGIDAYISIFTYVLDYLRMNGYQEHKRQITYMIGCYYMKHILQRELNDTAKSYAETASKLSSREAMVVDMRLDEDVYDGIEHFIPAIAKVLSNTNLTIEVFISKWMDLFGPSTRYACDLFIAFSSMMTDAYIGGRINNQKTIEAKVGPKTLMGYCETIFKLIGDGD